jgi:tetratricopeptide (TPR) repeat protein
MFVAARDCFAGHYGIEDVSIRPPDSLHNKEFGLVLAVHIAALVAVDAHVHGGRVPEDMAHLSSYLLDRERKHWTELYTNQHEGLDFRTAPSVMGRAVFTACLTGAKTHNKGTEALRNADLDMPERVLADHALCYPPVDPGTVLEPLYPDRLAEDLLALALPGHAITTYPAESWAQPTTEALIRRDANGAPPSHLNRALTFLTAAATSGRWPHITRHLDVILRADPALAIAAGNATLTALASLDIDPRILESIESLFPEDRHTDLDTGIAAITERIGTEWLRTTEDPATKAAIYHKMAKRLGFAGLPHAALLATEEALKLRKDLAQRDVAQYGSDYALMLNNRGAYLADLGRYDEALQALTDAEGSYRKLPTPDEPGLARVLTNKSGNLCDRGEIPSAEASIHEAVGILERLAEQDPIYQPLLTDALRNLAVIRTRRGDITGSARASSRAVDISRKMEHCNPEAYGPNLSRALTFYSTDLADLGRHPAALRAAEEATQIARRLTRANASIFEQDLAAALSNLAARLNDEGEHDRSLIAIVESVELRERLAACNPVLHEAGLARSLNNLGTTLQSLSRVDEAERAHRRALKIRRRLAVNNPLLYDADTAESLFNLGHTLRALKRSPEARRALQEAADLYAQATQRNPAFGSRYQDAMTLLAQTEHRA